MINETERIKKLMGLPQLNESTIDGSISTSKGKIIYRKGGEEFTYSVSVSNMFTNSKLHIIDFNISENSFTYLKDGEKKTEKIKDEKIRNIIQNMSDGVDSFVINSILYDIIFKKVK